MPVGLECEVLATIRDWGLPLPDEAQKTAYEGDEPIAMADFFYEPRILVFVDSSPHYRDYVQAADEHKRRRLKDLGYRVVVVRAEDPEACLDPQKFIAYMSAKGIKAYQDLAMTRQIA